MSRSTLEIVSLEIADVFSPILELTTQDKVENLFHDLGYELPGTNDFGDVAGLIGKVGPLITAVETLANANEDDRWGAVIEVGKKVVAVTVEIVKKKMT